jgi:hypothetical protein
VKLIQRFDMQIKQIESLQTKLLEHDALIELEEWIEKNLDKCSLEFDAQSLNVFLAGTKEDLEKLWSELRARGWFFPKYSTRPKANDSSWGGFFRKQTDENAEDPELIFLHFSSTICRRIKVGTKTVTEDIYQTVCGEEKEPFVLGGEMFVHIAGGLTDSQGREVDSPEPAEPFVLPPDAITAPAGVPGAPEPFDDDIPF